MPVLAEHTGWMICSACLQRNCFDILAGCKFIFTVQRVLLIYLLWAISIFSSNSRQEGEQTILHLSDIGTPEVNIYWQNTTKLDFCIYLKSWFCYIAMFSAVVCKNLRWISNVVPKILSKSNHRCVCNASTTWWACAVKLAITWAVFPLTYMQHCLLVFGPPNLGLSRQLTHLAQSSSIKQPLHCPQRRDRTPPGAYWLSAFLLLNLWPFLLPLLLRWMCSWEATHWTLPWSVSSSSSSSSSSAMSAITEKKSWVKRTTDNIINEHEIDEVMGGWGERDFFGCQNSLISLQEMLQI